VFIASPAYSRELARLGASPDCFKSGEPVIVSHGAGSRFDLMVFDPHSGDSEPKRIESVRVDDDDLEIGAEKSLIRSGYPVRDIYDSRYPGTTMTGDENLTPLGIRRGLAKECIKSQPFGLVVVGAEPITYTASVPTPAAKVEQ